MAQARKFGWFPGVFTPSILTILGVIMYLRLPSILGQAGLVATIGIIAVAHVISVCTGLSVASIATDKKVEAGGTYYMISRSLGLPIGGTLGLALFVGLSFSVSLYVIGFSESFLSYWGFSVSKDMIRLTGSITLLAVTIVTFLSTSLALKAQFYIMAAIGLSLISIVTGSHDLAPATTSVAVQGTSFIVLFGIFFPAVTGFEAGVSMSGDLKDPKKAIPVGTILAIVVGLVVYILLATFLSRTVSVEALATNPNVLLDISRFPALVVAGIWGATISSALGSILGAPRILQATAVDRITPRFFGKGFGPSNEPRNALMVTFVIAEIGILIGELNVIARIVSMFFITTYGFLNLSCTIERWASPDFRPEFKVPAWVSLLGAIACFVVMIQLDLLAMLAAIAVLGTLYLVLARRQLTLASGDTWEGVWSSVARVALSRLVARQVHQRNWRPNILLFAGSMQGRAHLRKLGDWLAYRRGLVSNVELVVKPGSQHATRPVPVETPEERVGFFTHRVECQDLQSGMVDVARLHGFAGVEPNTVLVGWSRRSREPDEFHRALDAMVQMDLNLLVLDYDTERDYGSFQTIDVWMEGGGRNASLALALVQFLSSADPWRRARVRILRWHEGESVFASALRDSLQGIVEAQRVTATVKVVQALPGEGFAKAVERESGDTDLTLIGLPEAGRLASDVFVRQTNEIIDTIGTVVLLRASTSFGEQSLGDAAEEAQLLPGSPDSELEEAPEDAEELARGDPALQEEVARLQVQLGAIVTSYRDELAVAEGLSAALVSDTVDLVRSSFFNLSRSLPSADRPRRARAIDRESARLLFRGREILGEAGGEALESQARALTAATGLAARTISNLASGVPARLGRVSGRRGAIRLRKRYSEDLLPDLLEHIADSVRKFDARVAMRIEVAVRLQGATADALDRMAEQVDDDDSDVVAALDVERRDLGLLERTVLADLDRERAADLAHIRRGALGLLSRWVTGLSSGARIGLRARPGGGNTTELLTRLGAVGGAWSGHQTLRLGEAELQARLRAARHRMEIVLDRTIQDVRIETDTTLRGLAAFSAWVSEHEESDEKVEPSSIPDVSASLDGQAVVSQVAGELRSAVDELPEEWHVRVGQHDGGTPDPLEAAETRAVGLRAAADYRLQATLVTPLEPRLLELGAACARGVETARDVTRLIRFAAGQEDRTDMEGPLQSVLTVAGTRLAEAREHIVAAFDAVSESATAGLRSVEPHLEAGALAATALGPESGPGAGARWWRSIFEVARDVRRSLARRLVSVWYRRSRGVILGERLRAGEAAGRTPVDRLLGLVESVSPAPAVLRQLPFYYRQLFLEHTGTTRDFWMPRPRAEARVDLALDRFRRGYQGGLLVVGDPGSGKSSLVAKITQRAGGAPVVRVAPPPHAITDRGVFEDHLRQALNTGGSIDQAFDRLRAGTVVVVDDLELWWERRSGGLEVIEHLLGLIDRHGGRCFFIVTTTTVAEGLLRQLVRLEERFLAKVTLDPFTAEALRDLVLVRHRSTGMDLTVDGRATQGLADWRLARFFNQLFDRTNGNVGEALQVWISSIDSVEGEEVRVRMGEEPRLGPLQEIRPRQRALLGALLVHRRLRLDTVGLMTGLQAQELAQEVAALRRSGLVEEHGGVLTLDRFIEPDLRRDLHARGVV